MDGWKPIFRQTHPEANLVFRNLGFAGDEVANRPRSMNFGSPDEWLSECEADVVFCFFGYNEALRGEEGLAQFESDLSEMLASMQGELYNERTPPRIVVFSPIAHENLNSPHLPDGRENNRKLAQYAAAMKTVCEARSVQFVDIFSETAKAYGLGGGPWTINGIHLNDSGNQLLAQIIMQKLFPEKALPEGDGLQRLNEAVRDKNYHWFNRYRTVDGYNVYGGRSTLAWFGQSNADVMKVEMQSFDVMTKNRDERIWAVAQGKELEVVDDNLPAELEVQPNKPGKLAGGAYPYLGGEEAMEKMTVHDGFEVNLFCFGRNVPRTGQSRSNGGRSGRATVCVRLAVLPALEPE